MKNLLILLASLTCSGCVYTKYESSGTTLTRISLFGNQSVGKLDMKNGTMEGYVSEQAQAAALVTEAAISAAIKARP